MISIVVDIHEVNFILIYAFISLLVHLIEISLGYAASTQINPFFIKSS